MDLYSLEELLTLQYRSFSALGEWAKQVRLRTGYSKQVTELWGGSCTWMSSAKTAAGWNISRRQDWGLFLLEWLFKTAATMQRRQLNVTCEDAPIPTKPQQPRMQPPSNWSYQPCWFYRRWDPGIGWRGLLWMVSCGPKHPPHWCQDQLMSNFHEDLGQWLGRAGLCDTLKMAQWQRQSTTHSNRSMSRGRTCSHACSLSSVQRLSEAGRWEGTAAPKQQIMQPYTG